MATYTDNYQLTKPTYAEQADIGVINSNMNKIDNVMHSSQISLAPAYDQSQTYAVGDKVMYELLMYKCISPTTGVWDGSKWERTTASESGGGGSAELDILGEGSGAVVSFSDGASAELAKCIADINPTQDLHGYSKPWAGGAGKNRFETTATSTTVSSITYTVNDNGTINTAGIADSSGGLNIGTSFTLPAGTYILSGCPIGGSASTYKLFLSEVNVEDTGSGVTFTITQTTTFDRLRIVIYSGVNADDLEFKPMICLSSASAPTTFEPYSNICPISGSTSVTVTVSDGETSTTKTTPLGQTVYGGRLNVLTGELTIDRYMVVLDGVNNIVSISGVTNPNGRTVLYSAQVNTVDVYRAKSLCDKLKWSNGAHTELSLSEYTATVAGGGGTMTIRFVLPISQTATATEANAYLASNNHTFVFPLATPQTVQLTPQEVNSLLGQNNISADTGDVDIVYVKASAPIQPNPTGTPTATLKKLGIEGAVFEVPSGGGGSSSGINYSTEEQVIGTWIDGKPLYQITKEETINLSSNDDVKMSNVIDISSSIIHKIDINIRLASGESFGTGVFGSGTSSLSSYACGLYMSNGSLRGPCVWGNTSTATCQVTVQYTKITD